MTIHRKDKLDSEALRLITSTTLLHYDENANSFWEGTREHDVTQNMDTFLGAMKSGPGRIVLDFGCGPGRDVRAFATRGHRPIGLDGSARFCEMARAYTHCEIWHQDFMRLSLPLETFDGIFANASLFHIPRQELGRVLTDLWATLVPGGILFSSNPRGNGEGWTGGRYGTFMELDVYRAILESSGFELLHHYYRPTGKPLAEQPWLATVSRKKTAE